MEAIYVIHVTIGYSRMIDPYNRNINYLRVSVTDRCNLRCLYCMPKEGFSLLGHNDILRYEEILRVIRVAVKQGVEKVRITGGEPLVRKGILEFMAAIGTVRGITDLSLTTNGILLDPLAEGLYAAGVRRINISLDSLNAEKYARITRGGRMESVLKGIAKAYEIGFSPIKINVVAMKGINDDEILDFARLTLERPYEVRFIELMPFAHPSLEDFRAHVLPNDDIRRKIEKTYALRLQDVSAPQTPGGFAPNGRTDGPARIYELVNGRGRIGFISPVSHHFCRDCNRLRLTADGHLKACLLSDAETDLKTSLRMGCSDDVIETLLTEAIIGKPKEHTLISPETTRRPCNRPMRAIGG